MCTCMHMQGFKLWAHAPAPCSISTVLKGVCVETGSKVIIKAYHKSKMHPKHFHKLQRELACMRVLRGARAPGVAAGAGGVGECVHGGCCLNAMAGFGE